MKTFLLILVMLFSVSAFADPDRNPNKNPKPKYCFVFMGHEFCIIIPKDPPQPCDGDEDCHL